MRQQNPSHPSNPRSNGCDADESRNDFGSRQEFFRRYDAGDACHHERIHDSQSELNRHRRDAANAAGRTLLATEVKTYFVPNAVSGASKRSAATEQVGHFQTCELK